MHVRKYLWMENCEPLSIDTDYSIFELIATLRCLGALKSIVLLVYLIIIINVCVCVCKCKCDFVREKVGVCDV